MKLTSEMRQESTQERVGYPSLWYSHVADVVVLMHGPRKGVAVGNTNNVYRIGYYSETWDMHSFVPFYGTVTLKSEAA